MREELFPFSIGSAPQSLDLSHAFPSLFAPLLLGAIFARSASRIDSQASTAGNSPRAYNFNCTSSPASGNDLLWFFLLLQLFLTTEKDNKPPRLHLPNRDPKCCAFVPVPGRHTGGTAAGRGFARRSPGLCFHPPCQQQDESIILTTVLQRRGSEHQRKCHHDWANKVNVTL